MTTIRNDLEEIARRFRPAAHPSPERAGARAVARTATAFPAGTTPDGARARALVEQFRGEWISKLPPPWEQLESGSIPLFQDPRVDWGIEALGGVSGRSVIELGPLEGGHAFMLDRAGASLVLSIEANVRAYLRCLVVQQLFALDRVRFVLTDFSRWLVREPSRFDVAFASGVLYHQRRPVRLLRMLAERAERLFVWTHYFSAERAASDEAFRAMFRGAEQEVDGGEPFEVMLHHYDANADSPRFAGGVEECGGWLTREALLHALDKTGWSVDQVAFDQPDGPNGPSLALVATQRRR